MRGRADCTRAPVGRAPGERAASVGTRLNGAHRRVAEPGDHAHDRRPDEDEATFFGRRLDQGSDAGDDDGHRDGEREEHPAGLAEQLRALVLELLLLDHGDLPEDLQGVGGLLDLCLERAERDVLAPAAVGVVGRLDLGFGGSAGSDACASSTSQPSVSWGNACRARSAWACSRCWVRR